MEMHLVFICALLIPAHACVGTLGWCGSACFSEMVGSMSAPGALDATLWLSGVWLVVLGVFFAIIVVFEALCAEQP